MHKRRFLASAAALSAAHVAAPARGAAPASGPVLLTITGAIARTNRGAFDPASDILMGKHHVSFERAFVLDHARIAALPIKRFRATLEYDNAKHELAGPLLTDLLRIAGAKLGAAATLAMRAVDGYAPELRVGDAQRFGYIVATHRDDRPLALGGLGPLWAVYEADRFREVAAKPVNERFATCPWALYHVDVRT